MSHVFVTVSQRSRVRLGSTFASKLLTPTMWQALCWEIRGHKDDPDRNKQGLILTVLWLRMKLWRYNLAQWRKNMQHPSSYRKQNWARLPTKEIRPFEVLSGMQVEYGLRRIGGASREIEV